MSTVGIDMSKRTFHAAFSDNCVLVYPNTKVGFKSFITELQKQNYVTEQTRIGLEATGTYHLPFCMYISEHSYSVIILNPLTVSRAGALKLRSVKTDKADAKTIRSVTETDSGYLFNDSQYMLTLKALVKQRSALVEIRAGIKQRLESEYFRSESTLSRYDKILSSLTKEIKEIERQLPNYEKDTQILLRSIPGVGLTSAASLVATVGDIKRFPNAEKLTAYLGLDCRVKESGTSIHGKGYLTKRGNKQLRHTLFNATRIAKRYIPQLEAFYQKKKTEGHHYFSALCATERKLVHLIFAVWARGTPYEKR